MRQLALVLSAFIFASCSCSNGGTKEDAGIDSGVVDAGPLQCTSTADCVAGGAPDLVCDPTNLICVTKCTTDLDCSALVASGVCATQTGVCYAPCGSGVDFCPTLGTEDGGTSFNLVCGPDNAHCVNRCEQDDDCSAIKKGTRCDEGSGKCIGVDSQHLCNVDTDCNKFLTEFDDYCFVGGVQCRCVKELVGSDAGFDGVCHRRHRSCTTCTTDSQCGDQPYFDPIGSCQTVPGDSTKYCLFTHSGPCSCGYFDNGSGFCAPAQGRSCSNPGCSKDSDCPGGSICNPSICACEARCRWDFANQDIAPPGCPPSSPTCWVDNENLDPTSPYYGSGRCKPACTSDTDCTDVNTNPHGGAKLKCAAEQLKGGGLSPKRCRANGDCMDDLECPPQPDTSHYFGYCDRGLFQCHPTNLDPVPCRIGNDPVTMKPYNDCRAPYGCQGDGGMNDCILKTCLQQGGAAIACNAGEYCCGEDKNGDGMSDPCPPPADRDPAGCYLAPAPPFCTKCMSNDDCAHLQVPQWQLTEPDHCTNGSLSPSCSPFPIFCYGYQVPGTMMSIGVCSPSTYNDPRRDSNGRGADTRGCPSTFGVNYQRIRFTPMGDNLCNSNADCNVGTDAGRCAADPTFTLKDGGHPLACLCTVGSTVEQCPNDGDAGTVFSFCRFGNNGDTQACMATVSCMAPGPYVFSDAGPPFNGCGLGP